MMATDNHSKKRDNNQSSGKNPYLSFLNNVVGWLILLGLACIIVYSLSTSTWTQGIVVSTTGVLVAFASLVLGGLLGFLFGIPRAQQNSTAPEDEPADADNSGRVNFQSNTNLEQISDWLTKILVGVGLTQIQSIPVGVKNLAAAVTPAFGVGAQAGVIGIAVIIYFLITGFLFGYLWTRLYLPGAFRQAELDAIGQRVIARVERVEAKFEFDATALRLAQQFLDRTPGDPQISNDELTEAIKSATIHAQTTIFNKAREVRRANWRIDKEMVERTVPIFEALVASDRNNEAHWYRAQLGYALKDQTKPDYARAISSLSKAIEIRNRRGGEGWEIYEFNRALCRVFLDPNFPDGKPTDDVTRNAILNDLRVAARDSYLRGKILGEDETSRWLKINGLSETDLEG